MKTIFFGASAYVLPIIDLLYKKYDLQLVVTTEQNLSDPVPQFCTKNAIPFVSVKKLDDATLAKIKHVSAPFAVLADFRILVKQDVIDIFPKGIINIHPSLLPQYRGPTPGTSAILDGKKETGVSLMVLDKDMDHGPTIGQIKEHIEPTDTSVTLYTRLFAKGAQLLEEVLPGYIDGKITPKKQDHTKATYTTYLTRESGFVAKEALEQMDATKRDAMIRAYYPWPGVWTRLNLNGNERIVKLLPPVIPSEVEGSQPKIEILLQVEGKKPVSPKDFLNGYPGAKELLQKLGIL